MNRIVLFNKIHITIHMAISSAGFYGGTFSISLQYSTLQVVNQGTAVKRRRLVIDRDSE